MVREKCRRMLEDVQEAQDVAQETLMRMWKARLDGLSAPQLTAWLYRTSTRLAVDVLRQRARHVSSLSDERVAPDRPDQALEYRQLLATLARRIPRKELEVALLARVDGMDQAEMAEVLETSDRTVRRLLRKLEARLERLRGEAFR